ncbi:MAG TPA: ankyrin repeat domain-containing protein [Steroidobacteraceae bacterium]|nr:ankyrin repeat domain-containing protein [Steroidobacteraceae bacterium]
MSPMPTGHEPPDELDEEYRRLAAHDVSAPSASVREAVHAYAARLARERGDARVAATRRARWARHPAAWRGALFGTVAAAAIAGLLVVPRILSLRSPAGSSVTASAQAPPAAHVAPTAADARYAAQAPPQEPAPAVSTAAPPPQLAKASPPHVRPATPQSASGAARESVAAAATADSAQKAEQHALASVAQETMITSQRAPASAPPSANGAAPGRSGLVAADARADLGSGFRRAVERGDIPASRAYLADGADVDSHDDQGRTALLLATRAGRAQMVDWLLEHGADPNLADASGVTPLRAAEASGESQIAAALAGHGAH